MSADDPGPAGAPVGAFGGLRAVEPGVWRFAAVLHCPACGKHLDAVGTREEAAREPQDGDFMACFRCGEVLSIHNGPLGLYVAECTTAELEEFAADPDCVALVADVHRFNTQLRDQGLPPI